MRDLKLRDLVMAFGRPDGLGSTATDRSVLFVLEYHANSSWESWPSIRRIARGAWASERASWAALTRLESGRAISITHMYIDPKDESRLVDEAGNVYDRKTRKRLAQRHPSAPRPRVRSKDDPESPWQQTTSTYKILLHQNMHQGGAVMTGGVVQLEHQGGAVTANKLSMELSMGTSPSISQKERAEVGTRRRKTGPPPSTATDAEVEAWCKAEGLPSPTEPALLDMIRHAREKGRTSADWKSSFERWADRGAKMNPTPPKPRSHAAIDTAAQMAEEKRRAEESAAAAEAVFEVIRRSPGIEIDAVVRETAPMPQKAVRDLVGYLKYRGRVVQEGEKLFEQTTSSTGAA